MSDDEESDPWEDLGWSSVATPATRAALWEALIRHAPTLKIAGEPPAVAFGTGGPAYALLVIASDHAGGIDVSRFELSAIDLVLREAFDVISRRTFAGAADLDKPMWNAAVRVMTALGDEFTNVDEMIAWAVDDGASVPEDELRQRWRTLSPEHVKTWDQLAVDVTQVWSFRRAM